MIVTLIELGGQTVDTCGRFGCQVNQAANTRVGNIHFGIFPALRCLRLPTVRSKTTLSFSETGPKSFGRGESCKPDPNHPVLR